jgi:hypothetical protein
MPLDGFHVVRWASEQFGAMSAMYLGAFALVALIVGVALLVFGAKQVPASWSLVVSGLSACALSYFIIGSAINGTGQMVHNAGVESTAWRQGPFIVAALVAGIAGYALRLAIRAWSSEESSGKAFALLFFLFAVGGGFVSVQIVRGGLNPTNIPSRVRQTDDENRIIDTRNDDSPVRRSVTAPRSR